MRRELRFGPIIKLILDDNYEQNQQRYPDAPKDRAGILSLVSSLFPLDGEPLLTRPGLLKEFDQCGEVIFSELLFSLQNGALQERENVIHEVEDRISRSLVGIVELARNDRFVIFGRPELLSLFASKALSDITDLERQMSGDFGRDPFHARGEPPTSVIFLNMGRVRGATSPHEAILLNEQYWVRSKSNVFRPALIAHELFHRMQYAFCFRTGPMSPPSRYAWFSEGTASWAETRYENAVTSRGKLEAAFRFPSLGMFHSSYYALPFWLSLAARDSGGTRTLADVFRRFAGDGDIQAAVGGTSAYPRYLDATLHPRWSGRGVLDGAGFGTGISPAVRTRRLVLRNGVKIAGTVPACGSHIYELRYSFFGPGWASVKPAGVVLSAYNRSEGGYTLAGRGTTVFPGVGSLLVVSALDRAVEYRLTIRGLFTRVDSLPSAALALIEIPGVSLDGFGNVHIRGPNSRTLLGFQLNSFPSVERELLSSALSGASAFEPGKPAGDDDRMAVLVNVRPGLDAGCNSIYRSVRVEDGGGITKRRTVVITTELRGSASTPVNCDLIVLSRADPPRSPVTGSVLDNDGDIVRSCGIGSDDCDNDCGPLRPEDVTLNWAPVGVSTPIVPYSGKVLLPLDLNPRDWKPGNKNVLEERHRISGLLP